MVIYEPVLTEQGQPSFSTQGLLLILMNLKLSTKNQQAWL